MNKASLRPFAPCVTSVDRRDRDDDAALISAAARGHSEIYDCLLPLTLDETIRKDAAEAYKPSTWERPWRVRRGSPRCSSKG